MTEKTLKELYLDHKGKVSDKWAGYLSEYDRVLREYRGMPIRMLEIGVQNGGGLEIWSKYFRNGSALVGCDIDPSCASLRFDDPRLRLVIGDANADVTREEILSHSPEFDIVIDDGSHCSSDIIRSFMTYFPYTVDGGVYVVEDLHASYWEDHEGGLFDPWSSVSFLKRLIDIINHEHWGIERRASELLSGFHEKYGVAAIEEVLQHIHSVEFTNSLGIIRKARPADNRLGPRLVAGRLADISADPVARHDSYLVPPPQTTNPWSRRIRPPDEEIVEREQAVQALTRQLAEREREVQVQSATLAERDHQLGDLTAQMAERDHQLRSLTAQMAERDHQLRTLTAQVAERERQMHVLTDQAGTREQEVQALVERVARRERQVQALTDQVAERGQQAQALTDQLAYVFALRSWRAVTTWWRIRDCFKTPITRLLARVSALSRTSVAIIREQGWTAFVVRLGKWLRGERRSMPPKGHGPAQDVAAYLPDIQHRYEEWMRKNEPDPDELMQQKRCAAALDHRPLISVLVPVYDPPIEALQEAIQSVLDQTYPDWELCIADASDDSACNRLLDQFAELDERVRVLRLQRNLGISGNSNAALSMAQGEFVALMDHDDLLAPFALFSVVEALNENGHWDILYSDEDKLDPEGNRIHPFLKPDWSPELLHSSMYVGHLTVYRKSLIDSLRGFRKEYDGSQDYDLLLRATEVTDKICHLQKVLYHWRMTPASAAAGAKADARASNLAALSAALQRRGTPGTVKAHDFSNEVRFRLEGSPLISIIIPTDSLDNISSCLRRILERTAYPNLELVVVTSAALARTLSGGRLRRSVKLVTHDGPFNFSLKCNLGANEARGEYLVFLNDDVSPFTSRWIEGLLGYALQPGIGGVSPKLLYADDSIQYAGLVTGVRDLVGTSFHRWPQNTRHYYSLAMSYRNVSILTGACLMVSRRVFDEVGGWDDRNTPIANSDLDFSFKIRDLGLRLVYTPFVVLRHIGHKSLGEIQHDRQDDTSHLYILDRWGKYASYDPYFPPGMRELTYHDPDPFRIVAPEDGRRRQRDWQSQRNLLLISHDLSLSGAPLILFEIARYLQGTGFFVTVVAPFEGGMLESYQRAQIPVILDPHILEHPEVQRHFWAPFHLVVANTVLGWQCVRLSKELEKPCAWLIQESEFGLSHLENIGGKATGALDLADVVVVPSGMTRAIYQRLRAHDPVRVLHYGINHPDADVAATPPFERSEGKLHIVLSGTLEHRKGADLLISALRMLPDAVQSRFEVFLVGRHMFPEYLARIEGMVKDLPNVHIIGEVARSVALAYIKQADIFVCASREETGPLVVMEAMALGKAVISTRVGAASEIIIHGENGYLVNVDDSTALAGTLLALAEKPATIQQVGEAAQATYWHDLTMERYGSELALIFGGLIRPQGLGGQGPKMLDCG